MKRAACLLAAALSVLWPAAVFGCTSCADALATDPGAQGFSRGIYYSILVIFAVLASLVAAVVRMIVKEASRDPNSGSGSGT